MKSLLALLLVLGVAVGSRVNAADDTTRIVVHCQDSCNSDTVLSTIEEVVVSSPRLSFNTSVVRGLIDNMPQGRLTAIVHANGTFDGFYVSSEMILAWTKDGEVYRLDNPETATFLYDQKNFKAGPDRLKPKRHDDK